MYDYAKVAIAGAATIVVCYFFIRWRSGNGLLTRLLGVVMPAIGATTYVGYILGKQGTAVFALALAVVVGGASVITMAIVIQRAVINRIREQADAVLGVVTDLSATSQEAAASAEEQASAVAQVTSSIDEIHRMSSTTTETSQQVVKVADQAVTQGHEGLESVRELLRVLDRFSQATDFVQVVGEVAEQSNLLAVNAGIEAAKAGDYGRGFSVVASEVRNLAEQSKEAAKQIRDAINQTKTGQHAAENTDNVISGLASVLQETSDKARQISGAAVQQAAGIKQISDAMGNLTQGGRDTALASQQIRQAAGDLTQVSQKLSMLIHGQSDLKKNVVPT